MGVGVGSNPEINTSGKAKIYLIVSGKALSAGAKLYSPV